MSCPHEHPDIAPDEEISPNGLIVMDKPPGPTGFDCIRHLRRTCRFPRKWKIGHLGTLDPFASGVMVIALGKAVKYSSYGLSSSKKYRARLWLGDETSTLDPTGETIATEPVPDGWQSHLERLEIKFRGKQRQIPPAFSAKHVDGVRSYKAAREGKEVELKPSDIEIFSLEFAEPTDQWVDFTCHVSGGTYVRALARDIALELDTVGHLLGLERIQSGRFPIEEAIPFKAFEVGGSRVLMHHLRPVDEILEHLKTITVGENQLEKIEHGKLLAFEDYEGDIEDEDEMKILDNKGAFLSLGRVDRSKDGVIPFKQWNVN